MANESGKAYAFFDCYASREELVRAMHGIRSEANTLEGLEMRLYEGIQGLRFDADLAEKIQHPSDYRMMTSNRMAEEGFDRIIKRPLASMKYVLTGECPEVANQRVASELGDVLNVIRDRFNKDKEVFTGAIAYEENGEYVLYE